MKLGLHLLETCRLRKRTATGKIRAEAEWWERRITEGLEFWQRSRRPAAEGKLAAGGSGDGEGRDGERAHCAICGELRELRDGSGCENGHFVCGGSECRQVDSFPQLRRLFCPICLRRLE